MPSSLIFVGLVVLWLLILVPAVARRQQEVARLSPALLSGRVLERPMRHRFPEVGLMERLEDRRATTVGELVEGRDDVPSPRERDEAEAARAEADLADAPEDRDGDDPDRHLPEGLDGDDDGVGGDVDGDVTDEDVTDEDLDDEDLDDDIVDEDEDDRLWERPPARYRPGRGGYDPEAAAVAAHAKYAFRQRVVLGLFVLLIASVALALLVTPLFWWATGVLGAGLAGYLTYLRRQVRIEESIRDRRAARLAGTRLTAAADDPDLDEWARRGREAGYAEEDERDDAAQDDENVSSATVADDEDWTADDGEPTRIRGTGAPLGVLPARRRTADGAGGDEPESSLPRLAAAPPPPIPAGTALVDVDDEDEIDAVDPPSRHRRASGE